MHRRHLWLILVLLCIVISSFLVILPATHALAHATHASVYLANPTPTLNANPTPTPDANTTLQMAQQEEANIQTILNIINVFVVVYPILIIIAIAIFGIFGIRSFQDVKKQGEAHLKDIQQLKDDAAQEKAKIKSTQEALLYLALGDRFFSQKDTKRAIEAYKKAESLIQDEPTVNNILGRIYSSLGNYEDAIDAFEKALSIDQQNPEVEMELGLAYRRRGEYQTGTDADLQRDKDYETAIQHLIHATELRKNYDDALSTLGGLYRRQGNHEKALEYYKKAYVANASSSYALSNIASLAWRLGKSDEAHKYYILTELMSTDRILTTHAEVYWDYYDLALAQLALGKTEEAKKNYKKAMAETPGTVQFDSVLNVLLFLKDARDQMPGLDEVIQMLEKEKASKISLV